jgi:hypothetical protein
MVSSKATEINRNISRSEKVAKAKKVYKTRTETTYKDQTPILVPPTMMTCQPSAGTKVGPTSTSDARTGGKFLQASQNVHHIH